MFTSQPITPVIRLITTEPFSKTLQHAELISISVAACALGGKSPKSREKIHKYENNYKMVAELVN